MPYGSSGPFFSCVLIWVWYLIYIYIHLYMHMYIYIYIILVVFGWFSIVLQMGFEPSNTWVTWVHLNTFEYCWSIFFVCRSHSCVLNHGTRPLLLAGNTLESSSLFHGHMGIASPKLLGFQVFKVVNLCEAPLFVAKIYWLNQNRSPVARVRLSRLPNLFRCFHSRSDRKGNMFRWVKLLGCSKTCRASNWLFLLNPHEHFSNHTTTWVIGNYNDPY